MPGPNAPVPERITKPPRLSRLPASEHIRRIRAFVGVGVSASAAIGLGLVLVGVGPILAVTVAVAGVAVSSQVGLIFALQRIRHMSRSLTRYQAAARETVRPIDRLDRLEFRFGSRLLDIHGLDDNEREELQVLRQARAAGWIGDHEGVRSGRAAVPRIGR